MSDRSAWRHAPVRVAAFAAFWTLIGLSFAGQFYISSSKAGHGVSMLQAVTWALGDWYVFAILSLPVVRVARRWQFEFGQRRASLILHVFASLVFSFAYIVVRAWVGQGQSWLGGHPATFEATFAPLLVKTWHFNVIVYWVIVAVAQAIDYSRKYRERELHAAELEAHLAQAQLHALQMQLNPHFLFNTLNAISALMHRDVEAADRMIARLSELLRLTLEGGRAHEVRLAAELEFLSGYLDIERARFGDRLSIRLDVDEEALDAWVPSLILQPLVENAIRHGIQPRPGAGRVDLRARREDGMLRVEIEDDGRGLAENAEDGVGLSNTRARLRHLYGERHEFDLRNAPHGGVCVRLGIPFRRDPMPFRGAAA
ncbi:MAG: sensor histidine kinase [Candidatus Binatia bacterium]